VYSAPSDFKIAVQAAVQFFDTTFTNNITLNIAFGWGEVDGQRITGSSVAESSSAYEYPYSYQQVRSALAAGAADAGSATLSYAVATLPTVDPTHGATFGINTAEEKALGLYRGSSTAIDGYVGLSSSDTFTFDPNNPAVAGAYDAVGTLEHEISEVLGRSVSATQPISQTVNTPDTPLDLFRFAGPNAHTFQQGSAYFSLDNGFTSLKAFNNGNNGGDDGDWASSSQADAFDAFGSSGVAQSISLVDVEVLQLLGYTVSPTAPILNGVLAGPGIGGTPTKGNGLINGASGADWLLGGAGNDTLHGGPGSDYLDGGGGLNTALYDGVWRQYTVTLGSPTTVGGGPEGGIDELVNIQRIQFVDGYLATSPTDTAGQVYRLYEATLGRAPDQEGLTNWVDALNSGASLQTVAAGFVGSAEFQADYGSLSNNAFVTLLYQNVLHRVPDPTGLSNWVNALNTGQDTPAQVVLGFTESQEDINDLSAPVQQGLWVGNADAAEVARLYDTTLGRLPDASGLANWTQQLENGTALLQIAQGFVGSSEFQSVYGSLSNSQFVQQLYQNTLHRSADPTGLSNWVSELNSGVSRAQVVVGFSESPEHIGDTAPHIDYGIWVTG
jgi:hypothetical protein